MLVGLDKYKKMLLDKIPNIKSSIIISGNNGIGKFSLVSEVVSELVSNDINVHIIKAEEGKKQISVEQIRELFSIINVKPFNDDRHIIIIDDADMLNDVSFNLLLKRLEEPKSSELFILVTSKLDEIADTIKSRCLNVNMALDYNEIQKYILSVEDEDIRSVLNKLGFNHIIEYINSDTIKSRYADSKKLALEIIDLKSTRQIANYTHRLLKDIIVNIEMLLVISESNCKTYVRNIYDLLKSGTVNKTILIEIMLYSVIQENVS